MEKKILEKIYVLRKIKPENEWTSKLKEEILESQKKEESLSVFASLGSSVAKKYEVLVKLIRGVSDGNFSFLKTRNVSAFAGVFTFAIFFFVFMLPHFPLDYNRDIIYFPASSPALVEKEGGVEDEEDKRMVAKEEEMEIKKKSIEEPIEKEVAKLRENVRGLKVEVLGMMIEKERDIKKEELTDREITRYLIEIAKEDVATKNEDAMRIMSVEESKEDKKEDLTKDLIEEIKERMSSDETKEEEKETLYYAIEELSLDILKKAQ